MLHSSSRLLGRIATIAWCASALLVVIASPAGAVKAGSERPRAGYPGEQRATHVAGCAEPVRDLRAAIADLSSGGTPPAGSAEAEKIRQQGIALFAAARKEHPECADDFVTLGAQLQAEARRRSTIKGTPFLGPIGWAWNNVYYRVFNGNDVMMGLFGWALLISPVILVVAIAWVMHGARAGLHKPYVPEHLRME